MANNWAATDLALKQQKKALELAYKRQLEDSGKAYELAGSQSERNMLAKGMQRSSYGAATLGNINIAGADAKDDILENRTMALSNLAEQRALLKTQLAQQLAAARSAAGLNRSTNPAGFTPLWQTQGFKSYADAQKARAKGLSAQQYYADSGPIIDTIAY